MDEKHSERARMATGIIACMFVLLFCVTVNAAIEYVMIIPFPKNGAGNLVRVNLRSSPSMKGKVVGKVESDGLVGDTLLGEPQKVYNREENSSWYVIHFLTFPEWNTYKPPVYISAEYATIVEPTKDTIDWYWRWHKIKLR